MKSYSASGFTLVETVVVIAITMIIMSTALSSYIRFFYFSEVDSETQSLVSMLRLARTKSMSEVNNERYKLTYTPTSFSVQNEAGTTTLENHIVSSQVRLSASGSIVFNKITGTVLSPVCPCTITVNYNKTPPPVTKIIDISGQGLITIQ